MQNVVFIMCDQLRLDALGLYGNDICKTPNIDALFKRGTVFDNMFATTPVCAPNRGAIATGKWPRINGLVCNGYILPETETTMMDVFRRNGYITYGVGKMHFGPQWELEMDDNGKGAIDPQPASLPWHGFDHCLITEDHRVGPYADYLSERGLSTWKDVHSFSYGKQHIVQTSPYPEKDHQTTWITDRTLDFIRQHNRSNPFFMWVSYVDPHHPFNPPAPYDTMYDPKDIPAPVYREGEHDNRPCMFMEKFKGMISNHEQCDLSAFSDQDWQKIIAYYYGMISLIDKNIGRIVSHLKATGQFDNTIFVFTTDHGEILGDHHLLFKNFPFDCVTRVPFMVRSPGDTTQRRESALCRSLDIMPTMIDLAGLPLEEKINGISLKPYLDSDSEPERFQDILIEHCVHQTIRSRKYRLTVYHNEACGELYDLEKDPQNLFNLWDDREYQQVKNELLGRLVGKLYFEINNPQFAKAGLC